MILVLHATRSPRPKKDELCITWESCMWSNIIKQESGLDFKHQGSDPVSTFYLMANFELFSPPPDATVYLSHLFLLVFPMAIVIPGKGLSINVSLHNGSLQKCDILHPTLKTVSLKMMRFLHWSPQQSCLPIISSVCILLKCWYWLTQFLKAQTINYSFWFIK